MAGPWASGCASQGCIVGALLDDGGGSSSLGGGWVVGVGPSGLDFKLLL
jgi:hypothetical protein